VDRSRIAVVGHSKGAEAALLLAVRHPELRAVVAGAPSSVVWAGVSWSNPINPASSWTSGGKPLPSLPYALVRPWRSIGWGYEQGLKHVARHRDAAIPIERVQVPVLLVCGDADTLWPSCPMARSLRARRADVTVLEYEHAGHAAFGPKLREGDPDLTDHWSGGTATANNRARAQSWPRVLAFLHDHLDREVTAQ
jgi:dienelactone hydrolase